MVMGKRQKIADQLPITNHHLLGTAVSSPIFNSPNEFYTAVENHAIAARVRSPMV